MAVIDDLETAKANIAALLASITANPKPDYSVDGKSVSWATYFRTLTEQLDAINKLIQTEGGPQWLSTQAVI